MRMLVRFNTDKVKEAVTANVILETGATINILSALLNEKGGEMLLEVPDAKAEEVRESFKRRGVEIEDRKYVEILRERCVNCGLCYSLCPVNAIQLDTKNYEINLTKELCIGCFKCLDACPVEAIVKIK
ncbi:MAG: 4Fe-4S dicluster-binding protein [Candidatus Jordarchaeales archaeon]|nr:4Fe-4S binding protein [Candidatus Jordarchaeia archaeon]